MKFKFTIYLELTTCPDGWWWVGAGFYKINAILNATTETTTKPTKTKVTTHSTTKNNNNNQSELSMT